jgi:hypothetical protein
MWFEYYICFYLYHVFTQLKRFSEQGDHDCLYIAHLIITTLNDKEQVILLNINESYGGIFLLPDNHITN